MNQQIMEFITREYPVAHNLEIGKPMSRRQLDELTAQLSKKYIHTNKTLEWVCQTILDTILYLDTFETPVLQRAACRWLCRGAVRFPEDEMKVRQAVKTAGIHHRDPLTYDSPMEIINSFGEVELGEPPIDPDTVPTLKIHSLIRGGLTIYDVSEDEESRRNMRRIINTHFGRKCSPWCLLQGDDDGELTTESHKYWEWYKSSPKRVAFMEGRLFAFYAGGTWWDRQDRPFKSYQSTLDIPGDDLGRHARFEINIQTGKERLLNSIAKGEEENGWLERYAFRKDKTPYIKEYYIAGRKLISNVNTMTLDQIEEMERISDFRKGIIHIPASVESLPDGAFAGCDLLKEVILPDQMAVIGEELFKGCENLRKIQLPTHLHKIGNWAFRDCKSLRGVSLPRSVRVIGKGAFQGCKSLSSIRIPKGVKEIAYFAFADCRSLEKVSLPKGVEEIGDAAFRDCCSLKEMQIPTSVRIIYNCSFQFCNKLTRLTVPARLYPRMVDAYGKKVVMATPPELRKIA